MEILFEDEQLLVCRKPAGMPTQTADIRTRDLVGEVRNYLKTQGNRDFYAGLVHRLDQPVEGILVFAKNMPAAAALSRQINENRMQKYYYAAVQGIVPDVGGEIRLTDYLIKDQKAGKAKIVTEQTAEAKKAELLYQVEATDERADRSLLKIHLLTGRFHQIRVQLANAGYPILNDAKYGESEHKNSRDSYEIALCAYRLEFFHPKTNKRMGFEIEPSQDSIRQLRSQLPD